MNDTPFQIFRVRTRGQVGRALESRIEKSGAQFPVLVICIMIVFAGDVVLQRFEEGCSGESVCGHMNNVCVCKTNYWSQN